MSTRTLRLTSPHIHGDDVRRHQRALQAVLNDWHINAKINVDGEYGPQTDRITDAVTYGLGILRADTKTGITPAVRGKIRHPGKSLTAAEKRRRDARTEWRARFKKRHEKHGAALAVAFAKAHLGTSESPPASNRGPLIDQWNLAVGTPPGPAAYWCGAFANACLVAAGFTPQHFMAYCPSIEAHARAGVDGWKWHGPGTRPSPGWLALFTEGTVAGHVELVTGVQSDNRPVDIGGNTSRQGSSSSQSNGGGVFEHTDRYPSGGFPIRGYCEPPYNHIV